MFTIAIIIIALALLPVAIDVFVALLIPMLIIGSLMLLTFCGAGVAYTVAHENNKPTHTTHK